MGYSDDFDYFQEVARSAFADMLFDEERNRKFSQGIKWAIDFIKSQGRNANVLDIGTGSGLLAMLAARHGADSIVTLEAFSPTVSVARKVIEQNGFASKIKIINKHSTMVRVGKGKDMEQKANILVAEVLDTELIGEGAIRTYNEAHQHLLEKDCLCVPHSAEIFVQIVESKLAASWFQFKEFSVNDHLIRAPKDVETCQGLPSIHDIQLNQLPLSEFDSICEPIKTCEFDFSGRNPIPYNESFMHKFKSSKNTDNVIVFFWWNIHMTQNKDLVLSCAPHWAHSDTNHSLDEISRRNELPFRDHWMQGCYYIPKPLKKENEYVLTATHDEFSWFFDLKLERENNERNERPICNCIFHMCNSRNRIMQINDESKRFAFMEMMKRFELKNILFIGDHSILSLIASHITNADKIIVLQKDDLCLKSMKKFIESNKLDNKIQLISDLSVIRNENVSHVIAEPYFQNAVHSVENITEIWNIIKELRLMNKQSFLVLPRKVKIYAAPVHFLHLYKIRWPLKLSCEGFDHESFDNVIELASELADENVESFSLWEYPCFSLAKATNIFEVNFNEDNISELVTKISIENISMLCNGIVLWTEWMLDESDKSFVISTGPLESIKPGELINWKFDRQTVHLIPHKKIFDKNITCVEIKTHFDQNEEIISFDFSYNYND